MVFYFCRKNCFLQWSKNLDTHLQYRIRKGRVKVGMGGFNDEIFNDLQPFAADLVEMQDWFLVLWNLG